MREVCSQYMGVFTSPEGCAVIDLVGLTCEIWLSTDFPLVSHREHELLHCAGYDHPGGRFMVDLLHG